jgi:hypothetical protein
LSVAALSNPFPPIICRLAISTILIRLATYGPASAAARSASRSVSPWVSPSVWPWVLRSAWPWASQLAERSVSPRERRKLGAPRMRSTAAVRAAPYHQRFGGQALRRRSPCLRAARPPKRSQPPAGPAAPPKRRNNESNRRKIVCASPHTPPSHCRGLRGHRVGVSYTEGHGMCAPALYLIFCHVNTFFKVNFFTYLLQKGHALDTRSTNRLSARASRHTEVSSGS